LIKTILVIFKKAWFVRKVRPLNRRKLRRRTAPQGVPEMEGNHPETARPWYSMIMAKHPARDAS